MKLRNRLISLLRPLYRRYSHLKQFGRFLDTSADLIRHSAAAVLPQIIQPDPREIYITMTANCNLRCKGCRYGRDFMPGAQLPWSILKGLLDDCKQLNIRSVRLYGGEPLLHKDVVRATEHAVNLGLNPWLTTNGIRLKDKVDDLYAAGLRDISVGYYGTGKDYDEYVQRQSRYGDLEGGVSYLRHRYGMNIRLSLGWVLMRPTCNEQSLSGLWEFASRYNAPIGVSLVHYSLPYFTEGPDRELQFRPEDRPAIEKIVEELIRLKRMRPQLFSQSEMALRSIPDWLLKGPGMRVPCDRYRLIWVGADGTVQLCYVTFKMGNLYEKRLAQMLFTPQHTEFARDAFRLNCPNCHCSYHSRIETHAPSRWRYS